MCKTLYNLPGYNRFLVMDRCDSGFDSGSIFFNNPKFLLDFNIKFYININVDITILTDETKNFKL